MTKRKKYTSVDEYLEDFYGETRVRLDMVRNLIKKFPNDQPLPIKAIEDYITARIELSEEL